VAANPDIVIRGSFFTFFLVCILREREEFQVMKFILGLKGTQFISGVIKAILGYQAFWSCLALQSDATACQRDGPGVGKSVVDQFVLVIWTQILLWVAFLVLPYAGHFVPSTGKVVYGKANALWEKNYKLAQRKARRRARMLKGANAVQRMLAYATSIFRWCGFRTPKERQLEREYAATHGGHDILDIDELDDAVSEMSIRTHAGDGYTKLEEAYDAEAAKIAVGHEGLPDSDHKPYYDTATWRGWLNDATWPARRYTTLQLRHFMSEAPIVWDAITMPLVNASSRNRMIMLLKWDLWMFSSSIIIWLLMYFMTMRTYAVNLGYPDANGFQVLWLFLTSWDTWQCQITYSIVKVFFALSSAPFFVFTIGGLNKLFTHTEASAYTRQGQLVVPDVNGLSAYLQWLKEDVLSQKRYRAELYDNFPRKKMQQLEKAVVSGETLLIKAMERPATALKETRKKKIEIDALLRSIVTREASSDALFKRCFPDAVIVEKYLDELKEKQAPSNKERDDGEDDSEEDEAHATPGGQSSTESVQTPQAIK